MGSAVTDTSNSFSFASLDGFVVDLSYFVSSSRRVTSEVRAREYYSQRGGMMREGEFRELNVLLVFQILIKLRVALKLKRPGGVKTPARVIPLSFCFAED